MTDRPGSAAAAEDAPPGSGIDVASVIETVRHRVEEGPDGRLAAEDEAYRVRFGPDGVAMTLRAPAAASEASKATPRRGSPPKASRRPGRAALPDFDSAPSFTLDLDRVNFGEHRMTARDVAWTADANVAERRVGDGVVERVTARQGDVEWDVVLESAPDQGAVVVEATVSGAGLGSPRPAPASSEAGPGFSWSLPGQRGVRMGQVVVVDAAGKELHRSTPQVSGHRVRLSVPADALEGARYPVTIDPVISPEYPTSGPNYAEAHSFQWAPSVASNGQGLALAVWTDDRDTGGEIYGARINTTDGTVLDPAGIRIATSEDYLYGPVLSWNGSAFVVAWNAEDSDTDTDVYAARVNALGVGLDGNGIPVATTRSSEKDVVVASNGSSTLLAFSTLTPNGWDVHAAVFSQAGNLTSPFVVSAHPLAEFTPAVASDGEAFLVVWEQWHLLDQDGDGWPEWTEAELTSKRVTATGDVPAVAQPVAVAPDAQHSADLAWDGTRYLVVWQDERTSTHNGDSHVFGARVTPDGVSLDPGGFAISVEAGSQTLPTVAGRGGQGGFGVVWEHTDAFGDTRARGARVDGTTAVLAVTTIADAANGDEDEYEPDIAWSGSDFLLVWSSPRPGFSSFGWSDWGVYATRLSPELVPTDDEPIVVSRAANPQFQPAVAWSGEVFLVAWTDGRAGFLDDDVYAARVTPSGAVLDPEGIELAVGPADASRPALAWNGTRFLVAWQEDSRGIVAARVSAAGVVEDASDIDLSSSPTTGQYRPAVAASPGHFLVAWEEERSGTNWDVYARLVASNGILAGSGDIPVANAPFNQFSPAVSFSGTQFLVAWSNWDWGSPTSTDVYARRLTPGGDFVDASPIVVSNEEMGEFQPVVAWDGANYLVAWTDYRNIGGSTGGPDVYAARVSSGGAVLDADGIGVSTAPGEQYATAVASTGAASVITWDDWRSGTNSDVYAARVSRSGSVLDAGGMAIASSEADEYSWASSPAGAGRVGIVYLRFAGSPLNAYRAMLRLLDFLPRRSDFNADGTSDIAVFRPSNGVWYVRNGSPDTVAWGTSGDIPVAADYDGDGDTDVAVFRPSQGVWYVRGGPTVAYGTDGDIPVPADYDGDGDADMAVFRPSQGVWYVLGGPALGYGTSGDIPVPADYDGDGDSDIAVFRPSQGVWYVRGGQTVSYGTNGDIPVPADYDGDRDADIAVFRPSQGVWYVRNAAPGAVGWGTSGDRPVPADYDGDGDTDIAVYRPSQQGVWYLRDIPPGTVPWGTSGDVPA